MYIQQRYHFDVALDQPHGIISRYPMDIIILIEWILIIDSMPYANSLTERYEEQCRSNSDPINIKAAQKIEQGLGRSVRGEKDYSAILIIGHDLVKFIKSDNSNKFFSEQTRKQVEIPKFD